MPKFTVCAAYYDADVRATLTVDAPNFAEACRIAIRKVDDGEASVDVERWDPAPTFVYGVVPGDIEDGADPWQGATNVPPEYADPLDSTVRAAAPDMLAALKEFVRVAEDGPSLGLGYSLALKQARAAIAKAEGRS